jgi:hypothetical protein
VSVGGSSFIVNADELRIEDKDIVLGFTTFIPPNDNTANHAGIAIASTEGSPLVPFYAAGINTLPDTYKQLKWVKEGTWGGMATDAFLFNYAVGIGSTQIPFGTRLTVGNIYLTDNDIIAYGASFTRLNVTGVSTFSGGPLLVSAGASIGIGTPDPQFDLDVLGDINFTGIFYQNGQQFVASRWSAGAGTTIYRDSNVGIGTSEPTEKLEVYGNIQLDGNLILADSAGISTVITSIGTERYLQNIIIDCGEY